MEAESSRIAKVIQGEQCTRQYNPRLQVTLKSYSDRTETEVLVNGTELRIQKQLQAHSGI